MQRLLLLGLNHSTAPLEVREKFAFTAPQRIDALAALRQKFDGCEAVLLNTCNRVEIYAARALHGHPRHDEMIAFLAELRGVPMAEIATHVYQKSEKEVIQHLFAVASSLDSMVIGETQILGQVRDAYDVSREFGAAGAALNPLFQKALAVGKQVMSETKITEGRLSVGSVAVDCAGRIFDHYNDKTVLCIGAGKMASLVLQSFHALKPGRLLICNRDPAKADALARKFGGVAVPYENLADHLIAADVVVTSTGSQHPIITRQQFEPLRKARRYRPIFFIDIALPRDVEAAVGQIENVYLYNLDDLQQVVATTQSQRSGSIDHAQRIVDDQVDRYISWTRVRELGPMIDKLYQRHHELAREEVERIANKLPDISAVERQHLEELARRIVNKLLHDPVTMLRESDTPHALGQTYLHAMEKLFQLDAEMQMPEKGEDDDAD
ncbi:MAG: glutamyl-tRNA reductase [Humisphaera sp.]|nr:glutamyl-tRNA reductase [Humisphaera sp.]